MHFEYVKGRKGEGENPPSLKLRRSKKATVDRGGGEWGKKRRRGEEEKIPCELWWLFSICRSRINYNRFHIKIYLTLV
jgi:hypothetical protein